MYVYIHIHIYIYKYTYTYIYTYTHTLTECTHTYLAKTHICVYVCTYTHVCIYSHVVVNHISGVTLRKKTIIVKKCIFRVTLWWKKNETHSWLICTQLKKNRSPFCILQQMYPPNPGKKMIVLVTINKEIMYFLQWILCDNIETKRNVPHPRYLQHLWLQFSFHPYRTCIRVYKYIYIYVYIICMNRHMYIYICTHIYIYSYICIYVCVCRYIYINTNAYSNKYVYV